MKNRIGIDLTFHSKKQDLLDYLVVALQLPIISDGEWQFIFRNFRLNLDKSSIATLPLVNSPSLSIFSDTGTLAATKVTLDCPLPTRSYTQASLASASIPSSCVSLPTRSAPIAVRTGSATSRASGGRSCPRSHLDFATTTSVSRRSSIRSKLTTLFGSWENCV